MTSSGTATCWPLPAPPFPPWDVIPATSALMARWLKDGLTLLGRCRFANDTPRRARLSPLHSILACNSPNTYPPSWMLTTAASRWGLAHRLVDPPGRTTDAATRSAHLSSEKAARPPASSRSGAMGDMTPAPAPPGAERGAGEPAELPSPSPRWPAGVGVQSPPPRCSDIAQPRRSATRCLCGCRGADVGGWPREDS